MIFNGGGADGMGHLNQVQELLPLVNNGGTTVLATLWQLHTNFKHRTAGHMISNPPQQVGETSFLHRHKCLSQVVLSTALLSKPISDSHTAQTDLKLAIFLLGVLGLQEWYLTQGFYLFIFP